MAGKVANSLRVINFFSYTVLVNCADYASRDQKEQDLTFTFCDRARLIINTSHTGISDLKCPDTCAVTQLSRQTESPADYP